MAGAVATPTRRQLMAIAGDDMDLVRALELLFAGSETDVGDEADSAQTAADEAESRAIRALAIAASARKLVGDLVGAPEVRARRLEDLPNVARDTLQDRRDRRLRRGAAPVDPDHRLHRHGRCDRRFHR